MDFAFPYPPLCHRASDYYPMNTITAKNVLAYLPKREISAHKGHFGRVLVVAGSRTMCGAGFLCAFGALRAGAGLVAWALPKSMQPAFAASLPEVITLPLSETKDGLLSAQAQKELQNFCDEFRPTVMVCGPGMGQSPLLAFVLKTMQIPLVLDADGLNFFASNPKISIPNNRVCIFTPHPGEMARLLQSSIARGEKEREKQVQKATAGFGVTAVLKGHETLVCGDAKIWKNTTGNSALSKGGTGDVLSGVIGGLWAQLGAQQGFTNASALQAAISGVFLHGLAGDLAAQKQTAYGVLAREVANHIPQAIEKILNTEKKR